MPNNASAIPAAKATCSLLRMVGEAAYADYSWNALAAGAFVGSSYSYLSARNLVRVGPLMQRGGPACKASGTPLGSRVPPCGTTFDCPPPAHAVS